MSRAPDRRRVTAPCASAISRAMTESRAAIAPKERIFLALDTAEAVAAGADYLVVGRPIAAQPDPLAAERHIAGELAEAAETRV